MDGRVKTLHPGVHGGLLAIRDDEAHRAAMAAHGIAGIDLAVINLYPFESVSSSGAPYGEAVENIDVGGPAMIRAAAKNHAYVTIATSPADYTEILEALEQHAGTTPLALRKTLAARAFARTAAYDAAISGWFARQLDIAAPRHFVLGGERVQTLRYGENPHQNAAVYRSGDLRPGIVSARMLQGKQLSWNNYNDANAAFELASQFDPNAGAAVAIIKHANPCGVALGSSLLDAWKSALACDPVSAFGGIIAMNRELDAKAAKAMAEIFSEVIIAPSVSEGAREVLAAKKNLRVLETGGMADAAAPGLDIRTIAGGFLVQSRDNGEIAEDALKVVTRRSPTPSELVDLMFAFTVAKHVKSNAIVYAKGRATVGIGAGQMSRVDSSRIAVRKAADAAMAAGGEPATKGSVVASDAFFPFADGLLAAIEAGATAVIQPGGSMRDDEVIAAADEAGIAMVFTGMRHFRH
jgi:phosphoribosylaminoimidazolecarboxamide formyltransferase/IMP cyclohydrolase